MFYGPSIWFFMTHREVSRIPNVCVYHRKCTLAELQFEEYIKNRNICESLLSGIYFSSVLLTADGVKRWTSEMRVANE